MNTAWRHSFPLTALFEAPLRIGEHRFKALCPSHLETHASCVVNYHRKFGWRWHCFACNADGDALDVLTLRGMAVREALEVLDGGIAADTAPSRKAQRLVSGVSSPDPSAFTAICDACRDEHATFEPREYGNGSTRPHHSSTALQECGYAGWEIAASVNACICPPCLATLEAQ